MIIAGYLASVLIGISLGLIGAGGSILTVPVLVYLFGLDAVLASSYSLFVVGFTSIAGSASYFGKGLVDIRTAFFFGIPSVAAVVVTRTYVLPAIPHEIFKIGSFMATKDILLMVVFAVIMVFASFSMIKKYKEDLLACRKATPVLAFLLRGVCVGLVTGLVGAGGGFLIIPALVNMLKLPMKMAVGTSLFIIALNSLIGFGFSLKDQHIEWLLLLAVAAIAIAGILLGSFLATKIDGKKLKPAFGWFVLVMGIYIIVKETLLK